MNRQSDRQDLVITRVFDIPVELVWEAWSDPELVMLWWGPEHYTSPSCEIDFREGGKFLFCMKAPDNFGGQVHYSAGFYKKIMPMERIEFIHWLSDEKGNKVNPTEVGMPPDFPEEIDYVIEFQAMGERTELKITEYDWSIGEMAKYAVIGMNQSLDKLAASIGSLQR